MAKGPSYASLILIAIVMSVIMIWGGTSIMNYVAHPYQNLTLITVALVSLSVGWVLLFGSLYSIVSGVFVRKKPEPHEHHEHHENQTKE